MLHYKGAGRRRVQGSLALCSAVAIGIACGSGASAQADEQTSAASSAERGNILQEVVVTAARKRRESVQTTPIAVTALNSTLLERNHIANFEQIGNLAPSLQINHSSGVSGVANVYLRGFGNNSNDPAEDPHIAIFIDGIYQPDTSGNMFDTFNIDQIEVQAGPQGTLLGKNAPVGAIYITSRKPTGVFGGEVEADYGSYDQYGLRGRIDIPLLKDSTGISLLAMNAAYTQRGGGDWIYNIANGKRDLGGVQDRIGRIGLAITPNDEFTWNLNGILELDKDPDLGSRPLNNAPGIPGSTSNVTQVQPYSCFFQQNVPGFAAILNNQGCISLPYGQADLPYTGHENENVTEISSNMSYKLDPVTLTLVNGFVDYYQRDYWDTSSTPFVAVTDYGDRVAYDEETAEFRISSNKGGGWDLNGLLDWVVGGYFSNFRYQYSNHLGIGVVGFNGVPFTLPIGYTNDNQYENGKTQSEAYFAHVIAHFTDQWNGTFGVRQSWDQKQHSFQADTSLPMVSDIPAGFHNTSFEFGTDYRFDAERMAYFRFAQGYEAGGYDGLALGNIYQPETDNTYEVGIKSDWLDKRLRVNVALFHSEIADLQLASAEPIPTAPFFIQRTLNAGAATVEGMDAQIIAVPIEDLTTHLNLGYLHPKFDRNFSTACSNTLAPVDCSGNPFPLAPKWTINVGADYTMDAPGGWGSVTYSANWSYKSSLYVDDPPVPSSLQMGYGLVDLSVTLRDPSDTYSFEIYGTNVLDQHYENGYLDPGGIYSAATDGRPAEWGIRATAKF